MSKKENADVSEKFKETIKWMSEKLDKMQNGDVVHDTYIKHFKNTVDKMADDKHAQDVVSFASKHGLDTDWSIFAFVMMSAGPLPKEMKTEEFLKGLEKMAEERGVKGNDGK